MAGYHLMVFCFIIIIKVNLAYHVQITNNAPIVLGATVQFRAELFDSDGSKPDGTFRFSWRDNALPDHNGQSEGPDTVSTWNVTYSNLVDSPGLYEVQVTVAKEIFFFYNIVSARDYFNVTALFNGKLELTQSNATIDSNYVSSTAELTHRIKFNEADELLVNSSATSVIAYWFIDCIYYGMSNDLTFKFNYTNAVDEKRHIEALVIASYDKPEPTTTVAPTTVRPNMTTSVPTTPTVPSTTTVPTTTVPSKTQISSNAIDALKPPFNIPPGTNISTHPLLPYICLNSTIIPPDPNKTYGYFSRHIKVKAPVSNIVVSGARWLHDGELLNLGVSCNGSSPYSYCIKILPGEYNVTGNETCLKERIISECQVNVSHYFRTTNTSTVLIIIKNEVTKKIASAVINIYEVAKQPQLSVIVVPVSFCALAVILIVFGAAYYVQSRNRYTIEVADFDFAQASDMEYMTFSERLKDSINRALNRTQDYDEDSVWSPSRKYGSMP